MKCPKCGESDHASDAAFCHMCGSRLVKAKKHTGIIIAILVFLAVIAGIVIYYNNMQSFNPVVTTPPTSKPHYEQRVRNTVQSLCEATVNNDYGRISEIYASRIKRYHGKYDISNSEVVETYRNYDNKFGVYSKRASIRWNTLQIGKITDGYSVVYVEDYHIDRTDKSKYSDFVLEKHIELDANFKIVSEYDVQLSKSKP